MKTETHWIWTGYSSEGPYGHRYGRMKMPGQATPKFELAHRYAWQIASGPIPAGMVVRHLCGVTLCVNPAHLAIGTHKDNMRDRDADGNTQRGVTHWHAILSDADVRAIRSSSYKVQDLARKYGVSKSTIYAVRNRQNWRHLP